MEKGQRPGPLEAVDVIRQAGAFVVKESVCNGLAWQQDGAVLWLVWICFGFLFSLLKKKKLSVLALLLLSPFSFSRFLIDYLVTHEIFSDLEQSSCFSRKSANDSGF